jgi:D-glycero-alpha-D-manno-heptose-7-phosphate kinase
MQIRARAPLRISFGGGGTDVPPYCDERGGAVLSATINRHAYATLLPGGESFAVKSLDYDASISYNLSEAFVYDGQLDLAKGVIDHFRKSHRFETGMEILLHNDAPPGSGLGSSSAITVALIGALAEQLHQPMDAYQIAETAYKIERIEVGQIGGKQDQYAAAFGGFNFIEFGKGKTVVNALRLPRETVYELEYRLVFAYLGGKRVFSKILENQVENVKTGNQSALHAMDELKRLAHEMKNALLLGELAKFGGLLNDAWENKKKMAEGITNQRIDETYNAAMKAGAIGGKITGVGGGGFMFFVCDPTRRHAVQEALKSADCQLINFNFVEEGVRAWRVK